MKIAFYCVSHYTTLMKKIHSFFWSLFIIIICAAAVACIGWPQLYVSQGKYGVLSSKTSGVYDTVIRGGKGGIKGTPFLWKWELIFPTNSKVLTFSAKPQTYTDTVTGTLPSAAVYSTMLDGKPDFTYSFTVSSSLRIQPEMLPELVEKGLISTDEDLYTLLQIKARQLADLVVQKILTDSENASESVIRLTTDTEALMAAMSEKTGFSDIEIVAISIESYRIPDTALYATARETYAEYQLALRERMKNLATVQATKAADTFFDYDQLERLGELFTKNPALLEYCTTLADKGVYYGAGALIQ